MATAIIAVGCAGGRTVTKMVGRIEAEFIAINADHRELDACRAGTKLLIGEARFQGRGGAKPHVIMEESVAARVLPIVEGSSGELPGYFWQTSPMTRQSSRKSRH